MYGLQASDGDFAVIMDADLQPPQLVAEMIRIVEETGCDSCANTAREPQGRTEDPKCFGERFIN